MAGRNQRENADWFSHDADASNDEKIIYLESKFGHTGYAGYFKLLECMTRSPGFKLEWDCIKKSIYASKFGISVTEIEQIVTECCRNEIKAFILENDVLFSPGLIKRLSPLLTKREYNRQKYNEQKQQIVKPEVKESISVTEMTQSKVKKSKEKNIYTEDFLTFWQAYPKKSAKADAWKAWSKLNGTRPDINSLLSAIQNQKQSDQWQRNNGQYIPNPATWLNRGQWEDEVEYPIIEQPKPKSIYREL